MLAVRNALGVLPLVSDVLEARPDAIIVEMGVPAWTPPEGTIYLATYGASRACAQAAAEALGLLLARGHLTHDQGRAGFCEPEARPATR